MEEFNLFDLLGDEEEEETVLPAAEEAEPEEPATVPEPEEMEEPEEEEAEEPETDDSEEEPEEDEPEDEEDEDEDGQGALFATPKAKAAPAKKPAEKKKEEKKTYTGPRRILAYGQELWIENDPAVTLDAIRQRIVDDYQYGEFSKDRTFMSIDEETGIVVPVIQFQKKG